MSLTFAFLSAFLTHQHQKEALLFSQTKASFNNPTNHGYHGEASQYLGKMEHCLHRGQRVAAVTKPVISHLFIGPFCCLFCDIDYALVKILALPKLFYIWSLF